MQSIQVGNKLIGPGQPVFVIAEAGVNHNGDLKMARALIDVAVEAGADAVKFQTFRADRLVTTDAPKAEYQLQSTNDAESQFEMLRGLELSGDAHRELQSLCNARGIIFLSTPFDEEAVDLLDELGVPVRISKKPNEVPHAIAFDEDDAPRAYDAEYAQRFWRALVQADRVFKIFRGRFRGKCSPVHLFWGAADLAVSRFSGRRAPEHPGGIPNMPDRLVREAYSDECSSCGFWAGGERYPQPMFFSYAYPEPPGFKDALPRYEAAHGEYVLPYDEVRNASSPDDVLIEFLQSTYDAAARLGRWPGE